MAKINDKVSDIFTYLSEDHKKVSDMIEELEKTEEGEEQTRTEVFAELDSSLSLHAELEEATLYPALEAKEETEDMVKESKNEHEKVKSLLEDLRMTKEKDDEWMDTLMDLKENVTHHVEEEEGEDGLFEKAKDALSDEEKEELCEKMEKFLAGE
jgi:hypothetical protein